MDDFRGKTFRKGDPIPADWANWVNRNVGRNRVSGGPGVDVRQGLNGPQIAVTAAGGPIPVKITTTVTAATWSASGVTGFGAGEGQILEADGTLGETIDIKNHMPNEVAAPRAGWVTVGSDGEYWLMEGSCSTVPA